MFKKRSLTFAIQCALAFQVAPLQEAQAQNKPETETELTPVEVRTKSDRGEREEGKNSVRATTTSIGKGNQALRDIPQSITVITEKLLDDRAVDNLKDALKNSAGISFQAAEGGEEDIRLRGFSLQGSGDIFIDGIRDPAFYDRDSFNWDRLEVLRGSASMLFGRGSTGGAVNQVSKQPYLRNQNDLDITVGSRGFNRILADLNVKTGENAAFRLNAMVTEASNDGNRIDKRGIAPSFRWGIGTRNEFGIGLYHLNNDNGIHYGLPWLTPGVKTGGNYLWKTNPANYYGAASDFSKSETTQANFYHVHRLGTGEGEIKSAIRLANYDRDLRASAIRFAAAALQPDKLAVTQDTFSPLTVLTRGTNNKIQQMNTVYAQSDYSQKHQWGGKQHSVQAGVDIAQERFENFSALAIGNKPNTTVGTPNDGGAINEDARVLALNRTFKSQALGVYAQDLMSLTPELKLLAGLRWDYLSGTYNNLAPAATGAAAANPCNVAPNAVIGRSDSLLSKRLGMLYQPDPKSSYHLSYGTSFNTAGDAYQFDPGTVKVAPESSRNIELGAKLDSQSGDVSTRLALFHSTKYNERNRDVDSVNACNYVLSGQRHAAGFEIDVAGRITPKWEMFLTYAFIPVAKVDSSSGAVGTEPVGSRPGLTPRHTAAIWTTYKIQSKFRVGGGVNFRSSDKPVGLAANSPLEAPSFASVDLMAEYSFRDWQLKANLLNATNAHYADYLYRGHYVPSRPRTLLLTGSFKF